MHCVLNWTTPPYIKIARSDISYEMPELILPLQPYYVSMVLMHYNAIIYIIANCFCELSGFPALAVGPSLVCCGRCIMDKAEEFTMVVLELQSSFLCFLTLEIQELDFASSLLFSTVFTCNVKHISTQSELYCFCCWKEGKVRSEWGISPVKLKKISKSILKSQVG